VQITPHYISASDGTRLRTAVIAPASATRGACVLLSGQTEFIEKYDEIIGELNTRGFAVATFDWRGQGGSDRLLPNRLKAHVGDFAQYDDDLASFMVQVVKPLSPSPPLALAHSMGGHILLRALHRDPALVSSAAFSAPMIAFSARGFPTWLARGLTGLENLAGQSKQFALGMAARDPFLITFDTQLVTTDRARFAHAQDFLKNHPDLRLAGPTWGWLAAAYRSVSAMQAPGYAEAITTPVLLCGAGHDRIVDTAATREFASRLPHCTYLDLVDAEHEILMETDSIRARFWAAFDAFAHAR